MTIMGSYLGIDPGASGGLAILTADGIAQAFRSPATEGDLARLFESRVVPARIVYCLVERVHSFPDAGVAGMFTFGRGVGVLIGLLLAHKIPFEEMEPRTWQKALGIPPRIKKPKKPKPFMQYLPEETPTQWKNRLRAKAQALFPNIEITLATADALLIAEVARRIRVGYQGRSVA
jgi:hypothetical protein